MDKPAVEKKKELVPKVNEKIFMENMSKCHYVLSKNARKPKKIMQKMYIYSVSVLVGSPLRITKYHFMIWNETAGISHNIQVLLHPRLEIGLAPLRLLWNAVLKQVRHVLDLFPILWGN